MRFLIALLPFMSGCAWWNAGLHDPIILPAAIHEGELYRKLGDATGIPYVGIVASTAAMILTVLIGGWHLRKTVNG